MIAIALILYVILSVTDVYGIMSGKKYVHHKIKPLLMPALALFYLSGAEQIDFRILLALLGGWLGDVFLLGKSDRSFVLGLCSFLGGHLAYIWFLLIRIGKPEFHLGELGLFVYIAYLVLMFRTLRPHVKDKLWPLIVTYMITISLMSYLAWTLVCLAFSLGALLMAAGSLFFIISDTILSFRVFLARKEKTVMLTYLTAQFMMVLGAVLKC